MTIVSFVWTRWIQSLRLSPFALPNAAKTVIALLVSIVVF